MKKNSAEWSYLSTQLYRQCFSFQTYHIFFYLCTLVKQLNILHLSHREIMTHHAEHIIQQCLARSTLNVFWINYCKATFCSYPSMGSVLTKPNILFTLLKALMHCWETLRSYYTILILTSLKQWTPLTCIKTGRQADRQRQKDRQPERQGNMKTGGEEKNYLSVVTILYYISYFPIK